MKIIDIQAKDWESTSHMNGHVSDVRISNDCDGHVTMSDNVEVEDNIHHKVKVP